MEIAGNQSMKNNIKYLAEFGYKIHVFSFFTNSSKDNLNLRDPNNTFNSNVKFHRLPDSLISIIAMGRGLKELLGRRDKPKGGSAADPQKIVNYYEEYNFLARLFHILFLFLFYIPLESLRILIYYFKEEPDIFYGVNWQGALEASIMGRIFKKPIITRFHGTTLKEHDLNNFKSKIMLMDEIIALTTYSDAIIMTNDGSHGDKILKMLGVNDSKIHYLMNGLDADDLKLLSGWQSDKFKESLGLKGKKIITMASRLVMWKRVDRGLYCFQTLIEKYKISDAILLIIGIGAEKQRLEEMAKNLGIGDQVKFLGGIPHEEMGKYFTITDIFLSLYDVSNLGNPILEAMYFGKPVVTINDGSTDDVLKDKYNSFLVELSNLKSELPEKLNLLLKDNYLRNTMSNNAAETSKRKLISWETRMRLEDKLIKELLKIK